jgi:hypothetical protein
MSQSLRQSELFTAQDWEVIWRSFTQINFNASDPPSINLALRQYIQTNYPEDFNDWIESSEFVAIIDLLSWLAGTLAFKTDINARENFMQTARAKESILRLARFLSYNARRNQPARGLLKIKSVKTDDSVYDAFNNNLQNQEITWNDSNNADWLDQMVLVLNNAFIQTNPYGIPLVNTTLSGRVSQLYRINSLFGASSLSYSSNIGGTSTPFEIINTMIDSTIGYTERAPNNATAMHLVYQSDGLGNGSAGTGFFLPFKQGNLTSSTFNISFPIENQTIDISVPGINQSDVWVQSLDDNGNVTIDWIKVPYVSNSNITFNNIPADKRNIFSVITRDNDEITIRFSDGRFGNAPVGNIRVWYRTSNGLVYSIRPSEMSNVVISLSYFNSLGAKHNLTVTMGSQNTISNSAPSETIEQVRNRAPQVYSTQNRMVSGMDYNVFPMQSNLATKIKSLVRVYSGQSRYIDLNDPTGNYQPSIVFGDDGLFYLEKNSSYSEVILSGNITAQNLVASNITPTLLGSDVATYMNDFLLRQMYAGVTTPNIPIVWQQSSDTAYSSTGYLTSSSKYIRVGSMLKMKTGAKEFWVGVTAIYGNMTTAPLVGSPGPVGLTIPVASGSTILSILPPFNASLTASVLVLARTRIDQKASFSIWYDYNSIDPNLPWFVKNFEAIDAAPNSIGTTIRVMSVEYLTGNVWRFSTAGARYCFESGGATKFFFSGQKAVDPTSGKLKQDRVRILSINPDLNGAISLGKDLDLSIGSMVYYPNGVQDSTRISVTPYDSDIDGFPDDPSVFFEITKADDTRRNYLFWQNASRGFIPITNVVVYEREMDRQADTLPTEGTIAFQIASGDAPNSFWIKSATGWDIDYRSFRYARGRGPNVAASWFALNQPVYNPVGDALKYQWSHYAPTDSRLDPAKSNLIDMYVLLSDYDAAIKQWIGNGARLLDLPQAPDEASLRQTFTEYENFKMFSDDIVWKPVSYRFLFGPGSDPALAATFKVIKLPGATMSNGEIQSKIIEAIRGYFDPKFWDFGETFYFTELAAYVHQQLATQISSFVIVPQSPNAAFGDEFEIHCRPDQLPMATTQVSDIVLIDVNSPTNLHIR